MTNRAYKRFVTLSLIKPVISSIGSGFFFAQLPNAIVIRNMRIKFSIEKNLGKHPNKAKVTVTNLAETTRAEIVKRPLIVRLEVGYDGEENLAHLFTGDLRLGSNTHDGPDVHTELEMGDGDRAFSFARVSRSFAAGSRILDAVTHCTQQLGLDLSAPVKAAQELQGQFTGGATLHGPAHLELTQLLEGVGMGWSVQDGQLVVLKDRQVRDNQAFLLSNIIGSPKLSLPKKPGESPTLPVKMLIDTRVSPGVKVFVKTRDVNGAFRVEKVKHDGDSRGQDWYTEAHCTQL